MSKEDTRLLQRSLISRGFSPGLVDGLMGPKTVGASARYMLEEHGDEGVAQRALNKLRSAVKELSFIPGIDISAWNGRIDWQKVSKTENQWAMCKATEGTTHINPGAVTNIESARENGLIVGAYHFSQSKTYQALKMQDARNEAENFLRVYKPMPGDLRPCIDLESGLIRDRSQHSYNVEHTLEWGRVIEQETGSQPICYSARWALVSRIHSASKPLLDELVSKMPLWFADYPRGGESKTEPTDPTAPFEDWVIWQFTSKGKCDGISGNVDLNRMKADALEGLRLA